jgi:hypothetical protein
MSVRIRSLARPSLLLAAALCLPACYVGPPGYYPHDRPYENRHRGPVDEIDGFVTFEGRCPTLREHGSEEVYALTGNTRALRPGDHARLSERAVAGNPCGSDAPTLEVTAIEAIWRGEGHRDAYYDARRDGDLESFLAENRDRGGWYSDRYAYLSGNVERPRRLDRDDRDGRDDRGNPDRRYESPPYVPPVPNDQRVDPDRPPGAPDRPDMDRPDMDRDNDEEHEQLSVTGRLDLGGSCPSIHTPQGDSWDLVGNLETFRDGDRVNVIGVATGRSACDGRALTISEIHGR